MERMDINPMDGYSAEENPAEDKMDEMPGLEDTLNPVMDMGMGMNSAYFGQEPEEETPDPEELLDGYIQALKALGYDNENIAYAAGTTLDRVLEAVGEDGADAGYH